MLKLKVTATAVLLLGSSVVFAGAMGPVCTPGSVSVQCEHKGWELGGKALYLQTSWGTLNFPIYQRINGIDEFINASGPWDWGFMIDGSYHFSTGNDVNLNWYHMNADHTLNSSGDNVSATTGSTFNIMNSQTTKPTWDAVNMEFGQHVDYSQPLSVRYHGGFEYARIDYKRIAHSYQGVRPVGGTRTISYNGFGPRAGFNGSYRFNNGLSINLDGAAGAYAGNTHFHYISVSSGVGGRNGSSMIVVPEIELKTGASYTYSLEHGDVSFDAGWMWISYFNPMMQADDGAPHSSDFSLQGPYLGLKWVS